MCVCVSLSPACVFPTPLYSPTHPGVQQAPLISTRYVQGGTPPDSPSGALESVRRIKPSSKSRHYGTTGAGREVSGNIVGRWLHVIISLNDSCTSPAHPVLHPRNNPHTTPTHPQNAFHLQCQLASQWMWVLHARLAATPHHEATPHHGRAVAHHRSRRPCMSGLVIQMCACLLQMMRFRFHH